MKKMIRILSLSFLILIINALLFIGCHSRNDSLSDEQAANPITPKSVFDEGVAWAGKGDYDRAIKAFNKVLKMDSLYTGAYFYRAQMWEEKRNPKKAISDYTKVLKLNPDLERAYNYRGNAWQMRGKFDKAIADYTKVVELNPNHSEAYHNRGNAWGKKGDYEKAIADFTKAMELSPGEAAIYDNRGSAWRKKGDYGRAIKDYVRALEANPDFAVTYNNLAWLLATCPVPEYRSGIKALRLAQKALELTPDASILDTLAAAYAEVGKFEDAVRVMQRIITMMGNGDAENLSIYKKHLNAYKEGKPWRGK